MRSVLIVAALMAGAPAAANIDTTDNSNFNQFPFGQPNTATYGQTFQPGADDRRLTGFSLYLRGRPRFDPGAGPLDLRGYVAAWDGTKAIGPVLFTSATVTKLDSVALQEFAFTTSVQVSPSGMYVAFLSVSGLPAQPRSVFGTPLTFAGNSLDSGQFVSLNNGLNFGALFTDSWDSLGLDDIFFKASFSATPEPAAWSLMIVGFGMVGAALRRRETTAAA